MSTVLVEGNFSSPDAVSVWKTHLGAVTVLYVSRDRDVCFQYATIFQSFSEKSWCRFLILEYIGPAGELNDRNNEWTWMIGSVDQNKSVQCVFMNAMLKQNLYNLSQKLKVNTSWTQISFHCSPWSICPLAITEFQFNSCGTYLNACRWKDSWSGFYGPS